MRKANYKSPLMAFLLLSVFNSSSIFAETKMTQDTVRAGMFFTVAQSKQLIAKAVAKKALKIADDVRKEVDKTQKKSE